MRHPVWWLAVAAAGVCLFGGCGTQDVLLGAEGNYVFTARDRLALPGETVRLEAQLQGGDLLRPLEGRVVYFELNGQFWAAITNDDGVARANFTPDAPGDYRITASVSPVALANPPPEPQTLLIACREAAQPLAIIDLDRTVVATGFHTALVGDPDPMPGSAEALRRLAETHTIVYLTHRLATFGPKSTAWLKRHGYPDGPLLMSSLGEFLRGSGAYKTEVLRDLTSRFETIDYGIGDKISDATTYHANTIETFLVIVQPTGDDPQPYDALARELMTLDETAHVVTGWDEIERALFGGERFPRSAMVERLRSEADRLRRARP